MQPPMPPPPPPMIPPPEPPPALPGEVVYQNKAADHSEELAIDSMMYRELTFHFFNKNTATGFATVNLMVCFYGDEWHHLPSANIDNANVYQDQHNLTTKNNNNAQHFHAKLPPGAKRVKVEQASWTTGSFTCTVTKR